MTKVKEKIGLSLSSDLLSLEETVRKTLGFQSRSELVDAALSDFLLRRTLL